MLGLLHEQVAADPVGSDDLTRATRRGVHADAHVVLMRNVEGARP